MILRSGKRIRSSEDDLERDRLSELPDDIILQMISCMPIIDAVRTVLLRRFGNLWTLVPTLKFDMSALSANLSQQESDHMGRRVSCFIRNVLMLHQNLSIDRFHLLIKSDSSYETYKAAAADITKWLSFGFDRQAEESMQQYERLLHGTESEINV
ncbi:F-box/FBD/LRR-repeat protein At5g56420-like [Silene latifolia]|uniref:F-box/FBD/LRR-repeat protein At5g56420-like n=1 Tax=Silene latifolia TaxID=37657 RepID=UPI003D789439